MKKQTPLGYLWKKLHHRLLALCLMTAAHVGSTILGVLSALGTRNVINSAISGRKELFLEACLVQAGIVLGILLCLTLYRYLHDKLSVALDRDWKRQLFHGLLCGDYETVSAYHSGELMNRLNNDVRIVDEGILATLPGIASLTVRLLTVLAVLFALDPRLTAVLLVLGVVIILVTGLLRKRLKTMHRQVSEAEGQVSGFLQEALENLMLVQAMGVEAEVEHRAEEKLQTRYGLQRKRRKITLFANSSVSVMGYGSAFAALVWCAFGILNGTMTFGDLTAITQLVSQLQAPFVNLSGFIPKYIAMTAACERLMELDLDTPAVNAADETSLYREMQRLCAEKLTFSYDRDRVLQESSFSLPKGAFAAIVGPSGIGKSTLLKLLLGIFEPQDGQLVLDCGERTVKLDRTTRGLFAYVPQGNLLFSGTLRENLLLTKPDASEQELQRAISISCLDAVIAQLPQGLETLLGENAHGLSEGQAQRLSIARAVLCGAPILLLDEATSALDAQTEEQVLRNLKELPDCTCIAVTHRPAALKLADWRLEVDAAGIRCVENKEFG